MSFTDSQLSFAAITATASAYFTSGNSVLMPVSHMMMAPVVAYAVGVELAPVVVAAYAVTHGIKYGCKVFSESESSSGVALAEAVVGGAFAAGTSAVIGVVACSLAASKLTADVGNLVVHSYDMLTNGSSSNCVALKHDVADLAVDITMPIGRGLFDCYTAESVFNGFSEWLSTGRIEPGVCTYLTALSCKAVETVHELIGNCQEYQ